MVASAVFILDVKGKVLIARNFRGDIPMNTIDKFMTLVMDNEEDGAEQAPVISDENGINYLYMKYNNLFCKKEFHSMFFNAFLKSQKYRR
jgi:AP-1 complex subunit mu